MNAGSARAASYASSSSSSAPITVSGAYFPPNCPKRPRSSGSDVNAAQFPTTCAISPSTRDYGYESRRNEGGRSERRRRKIEFERVVTVREQTTPTPIHSSVLRSLHPPSFLRDSHRLFLCLSESDGFFDALESGLGGRFDARGTL